MVARATMILGKITPSMVTITHTLTNQSQIYTQNKKQVHPWPILNHFNTLTNYPNYWNYSKETIQKALTSEHKSQVHII